MASSELPAWIDAATAAAVRLAAEAGAEVDDIFEHAGDTSAQRLGAQVTRLEQSAELPEVAADLAALLWAECEDVPPIATILEEPAASAALEAVAEARRLAAARLGAGSLTVRPTDPSQAQAPRRALWAADAKAVGTDGGPPAPDEEPAGAPAPQEPPRVIPVRVPDRVDPAVRAPVPLSAPTPASPPVRPPVGNGSGRRPTRGAALAGAAAAAILLFGRRLRRA